MILRGDCIEKMRELPEASIDAIVTDPPYGLEFMGKDWDAPWRENGRWTKATLLPGSRSKNPQPRPQYEAGPAFQAWCEEWAREALRVLKPGGHLLAFGGTRTFHRLASAVEDAGFDIRDCLAWMYGSGFPKSLDVSKAIDKQAGAEREVTREAARPLEPGEVITFDQRSSYERERRDVPVTDEAKRWDGWGTALKPAFEPVVVARKPFAGSTTANVLAHGTGALNIEGCRIGTEGGTKQVVAKDGPTGREVTTIGQLGSAPGGNIEIGGRWPANVILDEEAAELLDAQTGELQAGAHPQRRNVSIGDGNIYEGGKPTERAARIDLDSGGGSRFFYVAKPSRAEREAGTRHLPKQARGEDTLQYHEGEKRDDPAVGNFHPTVKPIALMRWLIRLVTPPGGRVLDPFTGSGTTGCAAALEGVEFIGCEREGDYIEIAEARIAFWAEHGEDGLSIVAEAERAEAGRQAVKDAGQLDIFEGL